MVIQFENRKTQTPEVKEVIVLLMLLSPGSLWESCRSVFGTAHSTHSWGSDILHFNLAMIRLTAVTR